MGPRQTHANSIYYAMIALAVTSAWTAASIFGTRPAAEVTPNSRGPAAVESGLTLDASAGMDVLSLGCWEHPTTRLDSPRAHWVRLTGDGCDLKSGGQTIEVTNKTNGFNATVFDLSARARTTDFIPLERGTNDVEVVVGAGARRRVVSVTLSH